jgi:enediyne biosynthesis protein E4
LRLETPNPKLGTLSALTGWWNSVTTGDIDGDGRLDLIAGNWGLNTIWQASAERPARIYYGDLGGQATMDLLEAESDPATGATVPMRLLNSLAPSMPFLRGRFPTHKAFSEASVASLLGPSLSAAREVSANTLASMIFFNRGDRFEAAELPFEAQVAPVFSINVADVDGDGQEDVFLGQNFFATRPEVPRLDAGRGLWLRGGGSGKLHAMPARESGVIIHGEQRGAALADFNEDGRIDLAVSQNGSQTRLLQNVGARQGLRVRLMGLPGNPLAIGAVLRLSAGSVSGPAREIHSGSGYCSQDSTTQIFSFSAKPDQIRVRWPGGRMSTNSIPPNVPEFVIPSPATSSR